MKWELTFSRWVVQQCSPEKVRRFGGTYFLYLQGRSVSQGRNRQKLATSPAQHLAVTAVIAPNPASGDADLVVYSYLLARLTLKL
jgi:hypothetical protein